MVENKLSFWDKYIFIELTPILALFSMSLKVIIDEIKLMTWIFIPVYIITLFHSILCIIKWKWHSHKKYVDNNPAENKTNMNDDPIKSVTNINENPIKNITGIDDDTIKGRTSIGMSIMTPKNIL